jgi:hypothetical protein
MRFPILKSMSDFLFYFVEIVKWGFTISLLLLIIGYLIKQGWRPFIKQWLSSTHIIVFVCCFVLLLFVIRNLVEAITSRMRISEEFNVPTQFVYTPNYWLRYGPQAALLLTLIILFIIRKDRNSFGLGLLALIALHYDAIINLRYLLEDYKWPVNYGGQIPEHPFSSFFFGNIPAHLLYFLLFSITAFFIYLLKQRWKVK